MVQTNIDMYNNTMCSNDVTHTCAKETARARQQHVMDCMLGPGNIHHSGKEFKNNIFGSLWSNGMHVDLARSLLGTPHDLQTGNRTIENKLFEFA